MEFIHILIFTYIFLGYSFILKKKEIPRNYIYILLFFTLKIIVNYRLCTLAYIECKLRNVERNKGYLNNFLDSIVDVRNTKLFYVIISLAIIILFYDLIIKNNIIILIQEFKNFVLFKN